MQRSLDEKWMRLAIELAVEGQGLVEPNPMVGCIVVRQDQEIGRGFHQKFGDDHAEIHALRGLRDGVHATAYVSLEPCCHEGKTGPCTQALIAAKISRVVVATLDPYPAVAGQGVAELRAAGVQVDVGTLDAEARRINAPYFKRIQSGRPWVIAKWAMTLDGKIATAGLESQWISNEASRAFVHRLRGRMDAIIIGGLTAQRDNPLLTARPPGPRVATRVVFDTRLELSPESQLVGSMSQAPLLLVARECSAERRRLLEGLGCKVMLLTSPEPCLQVEEALTEMGRRGMTNVLLEGGSKLVGSFMDAGQIDEVIAFVAPSLVGGRSALSPIGGDGIQRMAHALRLVDVGIEQFDQDICVRGRVVRPT